MPPLGGLGLSFNDLRYQVAFCANFIAHICGAFHFADTPSDRGG